MNIQLDFIKHPVIKFRSRKQQPSQCNISSTSKVEAIQATTKSKLCPLTYNFIIT